MSFAETAPELQASRDTGREQVEQTKEQTQAELDGLKQDIIWGDIPPTAQAYLSAQCKPANLTLAIAEAQMILAEDSTAFDDPDISPFVLDTCIEKAEIAAKTEVLETEKATGQQLDTTIEVLSEIDEQSEDLRGRELIQFAQNFLENPDIPKEVKDKLGAKFSRIAVTLDEMTNVFTNPASQQAFEQIISSTDFDLGAATLGETFAPVMAQVEASGAFAEADKKRLRMIVTGSQAQDTLAETMTDENGKVVPAWPEDNPLPIRPGVSMYTDVNQRQYLKAEYNGHITKIDMTGLRGETVGKYLEALSFVQEIESFGGTGILQSVYKIDFNLFGEEGFDMLKIDQILNVMDKVFGGFESSDGDIAKAGQRKGMIRFLVRLLNKSGTAYGFEESQADTNEVIEELNLHNSDGTPNWKQLDKLGQFVQTAYLSGDARYEDLKKFLVSQDS